MMILSPLLAVWLVSVVRLTAAFNFKVSGDTVRECGKPLFTWDEGVPPYTITAIVSRGRR